MPTNTHMNADGSRGRATITVSMPAADQDRLRAYAGAQGLPVSYIVRRAVAAYMAYNPVAIPGHQDSAA